MTQPTNAISEIFQRVEDKYVLTAEQQALFLEKCRKHITEDIYYRYTVHSLYFDTEQNDLIVASLLKPDYKMKLRLRCYEQPNDDTLVFLETKKKYQNIVYKRRIALSNTEANWYLEYCIPHSVHNNTADEIEYILNFYNPEPKVIIFYERECYASISEEDVRITFDANIRYRTENVNLYENGTEQMLGDGMVVMEIKAMNRYPMWLVRILSEMKLYQTSFSKYGTIYKLQNTYDSAITADNVLPADYKETIKTERNKKLCLAQS